MSGQRSTSAAGHVSLEVGRPFNRMGGSRDMSAKKSVGLPDSMLHHLARKN
jgi:hypothetical protein